MNVLGYLSKGNKKKQGIQTMKKKQSTKQE